MSLEQWLALLEVVILALTLLITVAISWYVARQTQKHFQLERSQEFISRFNSTEMTKVRQDVDDWIALGESPADLLDRYDGRASERDTDLTEHVNLVANFYQELGVAFLHKSVDADYTWDVFGGLVRTYWQALESYVTELRRRRRRPTLFADFEKLAYAMLEYDRRHGVDRPEPDPDPTHVYVFGYGSLMSPDSASKTASAAVTKADMQPAWLSGYARDWNVFTPSIPEQVGDGNTELPTAFLNLTPDVSSRCNGVLLRVPKSDLDRFDRRERSYNRVDVSTMVTPRVDVPVYTYVGKPPYTDLPDDTHVASSYEALVEQAAASWGDQFAADFRATTQPHSLPTFDGPYGFKPMDA